MFFIVSMLFFLSMILIPPFYDYLLSLSTAEQGNYMSGPSPSRLVRLRHLGSRALGLPVAAFAAFEEPEISVTPALPAYQVKPDLSNVENISEFTLSGGARALLAKNAFVAVPASYREFFPLYEENRYNRTPNFVTADAVLHHWHLVFDNLLRRLEEGGLSEAASDMTDALLAASVEQLDELEGTEWENAAERNVAFFAVASKLLDPEAELPDGVPEAAVEADLAAIESHSALGPSAVMNIGSPEDAATLEGSDTYLEDFSQYAPRGHYDRSEAMRRYFKAMMWYGRMNFRFKMDDEVKSAVLMSLALSDDKASEPWGKIYDTTAFFVGKSDDADYGAVRGVMDSTLGVRVRASDLPSVGESAFDDLIAGLEKLEPPKINSMVIFEESIEPDREKAIKGFRLMGQRFTLDASIFQKLIYRDVKENGDGEKRLLPMGLDIPAAMGSDEALSLLEAAGQDDYEKYSENMTKLRGSIASADASTWTENLYGAWLHCLRPIIDVKSAGWPSFMTGAAWARKDLSTWLASWAELKHDTILYAKQVYAELGGGPGEDKSKRDDRGYVEPEPVVYARLAAASSMMADGLDSRGLLTDEDEATLGNLESLATSLADISVKELEGTALTDADYEIIRTFGGQIEHIWYEINRADIEESRMSRTNWLDENPAAIVADVATDPNGRVLEVGTGHVWEIYAVVPVDGKLKLVKGGIFSYYEFEWPLSDRLTDSKWREMLYAGPPDPPDWAAVYAAP
jgi:hypothetical protein